MTPTAEELRELADKVAQGLMDGRDLGRVIIPLRSAAEDREKLERLREWTLTPDETDWADGYEAEGFEEAQRRVGYILALDNLHSVLQPDPATKEKP